MAIVNYHYKPHKDQLLNKVYQRSKYVQIILLVLGTVMYTFTD